MAKKTVKDLRGMRTRTTGIEWTEHTWNPFLGCSIKSAGCKNCYAMALAARLERMGNRSYKGLTKELPGGRVVWTGEVTLNSEASFRKPLGIAKASIIFVNSMSDFFHAQVRDEWRLRAFSVIERTPRHQYQILTKRPEEIEGFLRRTKYVLPPNAWIGATVEGEKVADRIEMIRQVPARIRFLSVEPLIETLGDQDLRGIEWVITGGESGPGARPCRADWIREVRDLCLRDSVAHFFKQWGIPENNPLYAMTPAGVNPASWVYKNDPVGKGGSMIDGRYWKEMPAGHEVAGFEEDLQDDLFKV